MNDERFDRSYQDGREAMNEGIDRLLAAIAGGVRRLVAPAAPVRRRPGRSRLA